MLLLSSQKASVSFSSAVLQPHAAYCNLQTLCKHSIKHARKLHTQGQISRTTILFQYTEPKSYTQRIQDLPSILERPRLGALPWARTLEQMDLATFIFTTWLKECANAHKPSQPLRAWKRGAAVVRYLWCAIFKVYAVQPRIHNAMANASTHQDSSCLSNACQLLGSKTCFSENRSAE